MNRLYRVGIVLLAAFTLALTGCGRNAARMDRRDLGHPLVKRALEFKEKGRTDKAAELLQKAIEERPSLARAHLELGILYDAPYDDDFIRAVYHYQRYLEKRPQTEKRDIIEGLVIGARLSFATTLPNQPSGAVDMIAKLKRENEILRKRVSGMEEHWGESAAPVPAPPTEKASVKTARSEPGEIEAGHDRGSRDRIYEVRRNDTLTRIAQKVYGDSSKWKELYEANREELAGPEELRLGQKIKIPDLRK